MAASSSCWSSYAATACRSDINPPVGYRFLPTDAELVAGFLANWCLCNPLPIDVVMEVDLYAYDPEQLPRYPERWLEGVGYYFATTKQRYQNGPRQRRSTPGGYWRATGKDSPIFDGDEKIGFKKILVFYDGRSSRGRRTDWVMHEYRLCPEWDVLKSPDKSMLENMVLCKVFFKASQKNNEATDNEPTDASQCKEELEMASLPPELCSSHIELQQTNNNNFEEIQSKLPRRSSKESLLNPNGLSHASRCKKELTMVWIPLEPCFSHGEQDKENIDLQQTNKDNFEEIRSKLPRESLVNLNFEMGFPPYSSRWHNC